MCHYADIGVDELICYVQFGHLPHTSVMRTIELLGKEVIPALDRYVPQRIAADTGSAAGRPTSEPSQHGVTSRRRDHRYSDFGALLRLDRRGFARAREQDGASTASRSMPWPGQGARVVCVDIDERLAAEVAAEVGGVGLRRPDVPDRRARSNGWWTKRSASSAPWTVWSTSSG